MSRAAKLERGSKVPVAAHGLENAAPHRDILCCVRISEDVHAVLGARQQNIDPVRSGYESRLILRVTAHE